MAPTDPAGDQIASLLARVDGLESTLAIQDLKARYAELVDARYLRGQARPDDELAEVAPRIAALFTDDATWDGGPGLGVATGRAEIAARMRDPVLTWSWHLFAKPRITVTGDTARGRWDVLSPCTTRDGRPHWMLGVEDDEYVRVDGTWLHRSMRLTTVFLAPHETGWQTILT